MCRCLQIHTRARLRSGTWWPVIGQLSLAFGFEWGLVEILKSQIDTNIASSDHCPADFLQFIPGGAAALPQNVA